MADKGFFGRLFSKDTTDPEVKALKERLDNIIGEQADLQAYDAKFIENEPSAFNTHFHADFSGIDQQLDMAALQRVYCTETWVYTAVSAIAKTIAGLPIKLEKRKTYKKTVVNDITGESEEVEKEIWLDACGDKLFKVFQYPNKYTTRSQFLMLLVIDLLTTGNYYIYLDSDEDLSAIANNSADDDANSAFGRLRTAMSANTKIKGMYRIPPALIKPVPSEDKGHIEGYVLQTDKGMYAFDCAEIIHVQLPNPTDPNVGLAPLIPAFKPVLLDRFSTEHMIRFYKSGARLGGIIETEKSLSKEQLGRFQRSFEANFTGRHNHHRTLILPPGMKYNQVAQNPAETALLDFCKYNQQAILSTYNVPPIKVGILEHANYANALAQLKIFFTDTIMPYLTFIEDGFNMNGALMPDNHTYRIKFDLSNVEALQENLLDKSAAAKGMLDSGLTVNEVRELVWKKGQIVGGDKAPVLEKLNKPEPTGLFNLAAPKNVDVKDAVSDSQADTSALSSIKPTSSTFSERVSQLVEQFMKEGKPLAEAIALAIAQAKTEGFTDPEDPNRGPEGGAPKPTEGEGQQPKNEEGKELGTNVPGHGAELVPTAMGGDKCPSCGKEQCECPKKSESDKDAKVPTLAEFLSAEIAKLEDDQEITADIIASLKNQYAQLYSGAQVTEKEIVYGNGFSKDMVVEHWKGFIEKTNPLIERRAKELEEFFAKYKRIVMNRYGGNLKTFGSFKARNEDDTNDILNEAELGKLIDEYIANIDKSLADAMKQGYADTLVEVEFGKLSDKDAVAALRQFALKSAKSVNETTREQLKTMLNEMFERGDSVQDIGKAINEKFAEINMGRVMTIARTEVLTAVSMGKAAKITHWQEQFPDKPLKKMWITAQDDRVRDSHKDLEGVSVDVNDAFPNGLLYPRDPGADDAGEVINCRCDFVTYAAEDQALMEAPARDVPGEDDEKAYDPDQPRDES